MVHYFYIYRTKFLKPVPIMPSSSTLYKGNRCLSELDLVWRFTKTIITIDILYTREAMRSGMTYTYNTS